MGSISHGIIIIIIIIILLLLLLEEEEEVSLSWKLKGIQIMFLKRII